MDRLKPACSRTLKAHAGGLFTHKTNTMDQHEYLRAHACSGCVIAVDREYGSTSRGDSCEVPA